jgi:hypothetical protein
LAALKPHDPSLLRLNALSIELMAAQSLPLLARIVPENAALGLPDSGGGLPTAAGPQTPPPLPAMVV